MKLRTISISDKALFDRYLVLREHELAVYAFVSIYIWKALFDIRWVLAHDALLVFFRDTFGTFLYLPPLGRQLTMNSVDAAYAIMDAENDNADVSRIENIEEKDTRFFAEAGFDCRCKAQDYICMQSDMVKLQGNRFKSKRSSCNSFISHYSCGMRSYRPDDAAHCLRIYDEWMHDRMCHCSDSLYQAMLEDSRQCLKALLADPLSCGCQGLVAVVNARVCGFTFGYELNQQTWCILYEIADLSLRGLAQYMFREFCRQMQQYRFINVMDDSGLANLRTVKLSYHPYRCAPAFLARKRS